VGSLPESYSDPLDLLKVLVFSPILTTGRKIISISGLTGRCTASLNNPRVGFLEAQEFQDVGGRCEPNFFRGTLIPLLITSCMLFAHIIYLLHLSHS